MTQLSHLSTLGIARETSLGTYLAPTMGVPFTKATYEDLINPIKDMSYRGNDTEVQGQYAGTINSDWGIDHWAYPDLIGHPLRGIIGPDTVTAGVTTTLTGATAVGTTTISTALSIPVGAYIQIDSVAAAEYAKVTAVSGSGPYTLTVTTSDVAPVGMVRPHPSGVAVVSQTRHQFTQSTNPATKGTYSLSTFDTLATYSYSDCVYEDVQIKIDPKGGVAVTTKLKGYPGVPAAPFVPSYSPFDPAIGWQWLQTMAGATSTRGLSYDLAIKRPVDAIPSSDGTQGPREIFQGALSATVSYKAIFENTTDLQLYTQYSQLPTVAALQAPIRAGGCSLALTMSKTGVNKAVRDFSTNYVELSMTGEALWNATDGGAISATLLNYVTTAY